MTTELEVQEPKEIEQQISALSVQALAIVVIDDRTLIEADTLLSEHKQLEKNIKAYFKPLKESANATHKRLCDAENKELQKILPGEQHLKREIANYKIEEQRRREAEEARMRAEAMKREEEDRLARAAEIEAEAAQLKSAGLTEEAKIVQQEAEEVLSTPGYIPMPKARPLPKTRSSVRMIVDRERIQKMVDLMQSRTNIPGIRVYPVWKFDIVNEAMVPEEYKKPSVGGR
jgi:hypothetical protein